MTIRQATIVLLAVSFASALLAAFLPITALVIWFGILSGVSGFGAFVGGMACLMEAKAG